MATSTKRYVLGAPLGAGGMAEVFRATLIGAEGFARPVAIKRVLAGVSADETFAAMLKAEAKIASLLQHPNIVSVLDFDRDEDGRLFLVMELVEGKDLRALELSGPLPFGLSAFVVAELLRALGYAHKLEHAGQAMAIVHRDVSPHNVLLSWDGAVKLSDFGIAKAAANTHVTRSGVVKGKVAYLSPEQACAEPLDGRSDLFAAGIILHELLTGRRLFGVQDGAAEIAILHRVLQLPIEPPRAVVPEVSRALSDVTMRLLERDRGCRYQTAEDALEALLACPEITPRAQLDLARLMAERFPGSAPTASRAFVHDGPAPTRSERAGGDRFAERPFGGFSMVDLEPATPRGPSSGRSVRDSGATLVEPPHQAKDLEVDAETRRLARDTLRLAAKAPAPRRRADDGGAWTGAKVTSRWWAAALAAVAGAGAVAGALVFDGGPPTEPAQASSALEAATKDAVDVALRTGTGTRTAERAAPEAKPAAERDEKTVERAEPDARTERRDTKPAPDRAKSAGTRAGRPGATSPARDTKAAHTKPDEGARPSEPAKPTDRVLVPQLGDDADRVLKPKF